MVRTGILAGLLVCVGLLVGAAATTDVAAGDDRGRGNREVVLLDDCDPTDPAWVPTGGCNLPDGDVTLAEFNAFLLSPLAVSVVGHPAWTFEPMYQKLESGKRLRIRNEGGRVHTFTEVVSFGGGRVPPLNAGLSVAPECVAPTVINIAGGGRDVVEGLAPGDHRFQCCIHPWMRALVTVRDDH
jgi:plastocyanin